MSTPTPAPGYHPEALPGSAEKPAPLPNKSVQSTTTAAARDIPEAVRITPLLMWNPISQA